MIRSFRLSFLTDENNVVNLNVPRANIKMTSQDIKNAMNIILETETFDSRGRGNIISKHSASLIEREFKDFNVI